MNKKSKQLINALSNQKKVLEENNKKLKTLQNKLATYSTITINFTDCEDNNNKKQ